MLLCDSFKILFIRLGGIISWCIILNFVWIILNNLFFFILNLLKFFLKMCDFWIFGNLCCFGYLLFFMKYIYFLINGFCCCFFLILNWFICWYGNCIKGWSVLLLIERFLIKGDGVCIIEILVIVLMLFKEIGMWFCCCDFGSLDSEFVFVLLC